MTAVLVTRVGTAAGSRATAAALACARSEPHCAGLLIELGARRAPRPTLVASAAARALEERLAAHLPEAGVAARGSTCHLALPAGSDGIRGLAAALPLADDSIVAVHLPPELLQDAFDESLRRVRGVLLRADLAADRALTALAARDARERGLRLAVLKEPLGWLASRLALAGLPPAGSNGGLPKRFCEQLLGEGDPVPTRPQDAGPDAEGTVQPRIQFRL